MVKRPRVVNKPQLKTWLATLKGFFFPDQKPDELLREINELYALARLLENSDPQEAKRLTSKANLLLAQYNAW